VCFKLYDLYGELNCKRCAIGRGAIYLSQPQSAKGAHSITSRSPAALSQRLGKCTTFKNAIDAQTDLSPPHQSVAPV
jgi:hypothetical protein